MSKPHLDSFIAASARDPFTAHIVVDTGDRWGPNAVKTVVPLKPPCAVLRFGDLASRPFAWPDMVRDEPKALAFRREPFSLRPHQKAAFDDVTGGFEAQDRGKLIMACGTGKTFTGLHIAEALAGVGGRVLYLLPSISLFQQSMREWAEQRAVPHRYIGVCSDTRAGRNDEDASFQELEIPVTTDPAAISLALREARPQAMTSTCSSWTTRRSTGRSSTACLSPARSNKTCCRTTRSCFWPCRSSMSMRRCSDIWRPATGRSLRWRAPAHSPTP